jgi:hypothetical protein
LSCGGDSGGRQQGNGESERTLEEQKEQNLARDEERNRAREANKRTQAGLDILRPS